MQEQYLGITIDLSRDALFDELGLSTLKERYMKDDETSPQHRFAFVAKTFASDDAHAQRLYDYASQHQLSFATPILSYGRSERGLPISCYLNYVEDTAAGLVDNLSETNWLSMTGGGVGIGFGIRSQDEKSTGVMPHLKIYDASSLAYRQGKTRRGSYAAYLDISHPDIKQFMEVRKPTGDPNVRCMNLNHGVNISDAFMQIVEKCTIDPEADDSWPLIDPHTKEVIEIVSARELWQQLLELRVQHGEPYLLFIDTANRALPQHLKEKGLEIRQSNLCSEIMLPTNGKRTAVCCLSSVNLENYDDWKNNGMFLKDIARMLDNVLNTFINNAPDVLARAIYSAKHERSIGIGAMGFHSYLQKYGIPFESVMAKVANNRIFSYIREELNKANQELGTELGEAPDAIGTGKRFSHLMAIAPNATSSIIMGNTSPSIEPFAACAYKQVTLSGSHLTKNKYLDRIIKEKCEADSSLNYDEIWSSIMSNDGSAQHLKFLDDSTKEVFKTAFELDQRWIVEHAADRQNYVDQGQSVNLFFRPNCNILYLHVIHMLAWKQGLKALYYCRSSKIGSADKIANKIEREVIKAVDLQALADNSNDCLACEG